MQKIASQPYLFPELEQERVKKSVLEDIRARDAKSALRALYKVRNKLGENLFEPFVTDAIDQIRRLYNSDEAQFRERILFAIEIQGAGSATEISEDTKIAKEFVDQTLLDLEKKGAVYSVPRYIPGSDRQYFLWKSNRVESGEMDDVSAKGPEEIDYLI